MDRSLRHRLLIGPLLLGAVLATLVLDHWIEQATRSDDWIGLRGAGLVVLLLVVVPLATRELAALFTAERVGPAKLTAVAGSGLIIVHGFLTQFEAFKPIAASSFVSIIVAVMLLAALQRAMVQDPHQSISRMAGTLLAVLYLGGLAWFMIALRVKSGFTLFGDPFIGSTMHLVMIFVAVKFTDIGAFFVGRRFGRRKLIPWLSPAKTREGLAGGLVTAVVVGALFSPWIVHLPWYKGALFGLLIGAVGQLGDLLESMMKRDADLKDSGSSVPGFGGVLDVIDSPLLAAPFAYLLFSLF